MYKKLVIAVLAAAMLLPTACVMEFDNAGSMLAGAVKEYKETVDMSGKYQSGKPMKLDLEMKLAKAVIDSTEDKLADVGFEYNFEVLKPEFKVDEDVISIRNKADKFNLGKPVNRWYVKLADKVPFEVELKADASNLKLDIGGLMINNIDAKLAASDAKLYFDEPNKGDTDEFRLDADASSADLYGVGNVGCEVLAIDADASRISVDLTGENDRDGEVRINANASTVKLKLPEDMGVKIIIDRNEISSVRINNSDILSHSEKEYVSRNFEDARKTLMIYADLNVTTLTIE